MIKLAFRIMAVFWMTSPIWYMVLRSFKVFDFTYDWFVGGILGLLSFSVMFLAYKNWD